MTDTPEGAPSKRAMEVVPQVFIAAGHMPQLRLAELERAARFLDAEFRKGEELPPDPPYTHQADIVESIIGSVEFLTRKWIERGEITENEVGNLVALALIHTTAEWLMRMGETPPAGTPSPP